MWRAGVATGEFFSKVALGPHAEQLREMLLAEDPGEPWEYGCLTIGIHRRGNMVPVIVQPTPLKILDAKGVRFTFGGYFWAYRIASHKPVQQGFTEAVLQRSGRLAVKFEALETSGFFRDFLRQSEIKRAAQPYSILDLGRRPAWGKKKGAKMLNADERNERWLKVSIGLMRFEEHMMPLVQQLGRMDVRLIQADETWPDRFSQKPLSYDDGTALHEHITLSYLWVLGAYGVHPHTSVTA